MHLQIPSLALVVVDIEKAASKSLKPVLFYRNDYYGPKSLQVAFFIFRWCHFEGHMSYMPLTPLSVVNCASAGTLPAEAESLLPLQGKLNERQRAKDTTRTRVQGGQSTKYNKPHPTGRTHWGNAADPPGQQQGRYPEASGPSRMSPRAMEATSDRRAGTQCRRGSPAKRREPATQATGVRRSYRRQRGQYPVW